MKNNYLVIFTDSNVFTTSKAFRCNESDAGVIERLEYLELLHPNCKVQFLNMDRIPPLFDGSDEE